MTFRPSPFSTSSRRIVWTSCLLVLSGAVASESHAETAPEGAPVPTVDTAKSTAPEIDISDSELPAKETSESPESLPEDELESNPAVEANTNDSPVNSTAANDGSQEVAGENTATPDLDMDSRPYDRERPNWGVGVSYSPEALGDGGTLPDASSHAAGKVRGISLQMEWEPAFIQLIGVLGLGVNAQIYPEYPKTGLTKTAASLLSYGAQVRYQLKFFRGQWIVPMAGYSAEQVQYSLPGSVKGSFVSSGPFAGAMLLLNPFDRSSAGEFYASMGVKRTYLFAEMRMRSGTAGAEGVKFGENSWFAGVRSEW